MKKLWLGNSEETVLHKLDDLKKRVPVTDAR